MKGLALILMLALQPAGRDDAARRLESCVSIDLRNGTLKDAIRQVHEATGVDFILQEGGDVPARLTLREVRCRTVLKLLLEPLGLGATLWEGAVVIANRECLGEPVTVRIYDIGALLRKKRDFPGPEPKPFTPVILAGPAVEIMACFCTPENFFLDLIRDDTGGRSWDRDPRVSLNLTDGRLFVCQTARVHREIRDFLALLESSGFSLPTDLRGD